MGWFGPDAKIVAAACTNISERTALAAACHVVERVFLVHHETPTTLLASEFLIAVVAVLDPVPRTELTVLDTEIDGVILAREFARGQGRVFVCHVATS